VDGPEAGLGIVDRLDLEDYRYLHATRGELLRRLRRTEEARDAYRLRWRWPTTTPSGACSSGGWRSWARLPTPRGNDVSDELLELVACEAEDAVADPDEVARTYRRLEHRLTGSPAGRLGRCRCGCPGRRRSRTGGRRHAARRGCGRDDQIVGDLVVSWARPILIGVA
jgi:hypothetical protein